MLKSITTTTYCFSWTDEDYQMCKWLFCFFWQIMMYTINCKWYIYSTITILDCWPPIKSSSLNKNIITIMVKYTATKMKCLHVQKLICFTLATIRKCTVLIENNNFIRWTLSKPNKITKPSIKTLLKVSDFFQPSVKAPW